MSSSIAFALRAGDEDTFAGAVLCVGPNGEALDTKAALDEGDGVIVVPDTDSWTITALDEHPQFKRVAVPEEPAAVVDRFEAMNASALRDEAKRLGVESPGRSREELLESVRAAVKPDEEA
jgi:hypothetical protein